MLFGYIICFRLPIFAHGCPGTNNFQAVKVYTFRISMNYSTYRRLRILCLLVLRLRVGRVGPVGLLHDKHPRSRLTAVMAPYPVPESVLPVVG